MSYKVIEAFLQHQGIWFLMGMQLATAETHREKVVMQGN
jgi:hypothetical protein